MPGKKEQFRFRIPWISGSSTGSQSRRPKQTSKSPPQLHTKYTPIQRPPFRPPGIASLPPQHPLHTTASASGLQKETRETTVERKMKLATATSNPSGKDINVTADPMITRNNVSTVSKDDVPDFVNKVATVIPTQQQQQQPIDEKTVSVVTLAGENRGATMNVADSHSQSTRKRGSINIHRTNQEKEEEKDETGKAYVNSNIQSMNNSFMLHGSINGRDPGVRVIFPQQSEPEDKRGLENNNNNNISRVERLTYRPMVRRRCLRGLFHEPSDSDPDNPNKPRRHGCKFSCGDVRKDKDTDIF